MSISKLNIIAVGGGRIYNGETKMIDKYIASILPLNNRVIALLATASKDREDYITAVQQAYNDLGVEIVVIYEKDLGTDHFDVILNNVGAIYVGGGDPVYLINKLRDTKALNKILDFIRSGNIILGLSAGCSLLFQEVLYFENEKSEILSCPGILQGAIIPHYTADLLDKLSVDIIASDVPNIIFGLSDGVALHFSDVSTYKTIKESYSNGAWQIFRESDDLVAKQI